MKATIEYIQWLQYERMRINATPLEEIEFSENGARVIIDKKLIEEFEIIGLNNMDYILSGYYLQGNQSK